MHPSGVKTTGTTPILTSEKVMQSGLRMPAKKKKKKKVFKMDGHRIEYSVKT